MILNLINENGLNPMRTIKSFVLRKGRLSKSQRSALNQFNPSLNSQKNLNFLNFNEIFGNNHPIIIDIGFGNGEDLLHQAVSNPNYNFLGIEVYLAGIGTVLNRIKELALSNLSLQFGDAREIVKEKIPRNSISRVHLLFPDPWPKTRHHKRRLIQEGFVENILNILTINGVFHVVTDWEPYAMHIQEVVSKIKHFKRGNTQIHPQGIYLSRKTTKYELKGLFENRRIWELTYYKK